MKVFRFMSGEEFEKYLKGENLVNNKNHSKEFGWKTNSVGFCFFNYAQYKPEDMLHSLTGIVNLNVCCLFEADRKKLRRTWGTYSKALEKDSSERKVIIAHEYCTTEYSKKDFKLIEYAIPDWFNWNKWEWKEMLENDNK